MDDYHNRDIEEEIEDAEEQPTHFFCKLTFGQFFTLMVLEIITLSFVFYLGARYGNEYLRLDVLSEQTREPISIVSGSGETAVAGTAAQEEELNLANKTDEELREIARKTMRGGEKGDLKQRVEEILARQQNPGRPPSQENAFDTEASEEAPSDIRFSIGSAVGSGEQATEGTEGTTGEEPTQYPISGSVGTPETEQVVKVKSGGSKYSVQVGSYPDVKEASYRVEEWKAKGYPAYMMIADLGGKGQWYRVRIGAFPDKDEAGVYLDNLAKKEEISDAIVVKNEQ